MRYKSAFARDSFDFETLGAAIVGSSSPGILCLIVDPANRPRKNTAGEQEEECTTLSRLPGRGVLEIHALTTTLALWPDGSRKAETRSFPVGRRVGKLQQLLIASDLEKHILAHDLKDFPKTVSSTASVNENHDQFLSTILT